MMILPCFSFHAHTRFKNSSRPRSYLVLRSSFLSAFSTCTCVAIPAWSVPGSQSTSLPSMRALRLRMSWMVLFSTCPMWSMPVTFGGGMTMENAGLMDFAFAVKHEFSCQNLYHLSSTACGSYAFGISDIVNLPQRHREDRVGIQTRFSVPLWLKNYFFIKAYSMLS